MKESELQNAIGSLPKSIKLERDLWPGINERLESIERSGTVRKPAGFWLKPAMAAAILIALTTGIFIGRGMDVGPVEQSSQTLMQYALIGTVKATEREYQAAFSELVPPGILGSASGWFRTGCIEGKLGRLAAGRDISVGGP